MDTKSLILHQLKCEWLSFRWLIALWSIVLIWSGWMLFSWNESWLPYRERGIRNEEDLPYAVIIGFVILFSIAIFKRDDFRNVRSFWQTRPIRETPLNLAKFIFFFAVVALPVTLLFFVNIWIYDSFIMAVFTGSEVMAYLLLAMAFVALLMQNSSGIFSSIKPLIWISLLSIISAIGISCWYYFISDTARLGRDYSTFLGFYIALILLAIAFNWLWFRQSKSSKIGTHFKHYLFIPIILICSQLLVGIIMDSISTPEEELSFTLEQDRMTMGVSHHHYRGEISATLLINDKEYMNRIVSQSLQCDFKNARISVYETSSGSRPASFAPLEVSKGRINLNYEAPLESYEGIRFSITIPRSSSFPEQVRITGYCYVELAEANEILSIPYKESATVKSNRMEFAWRQKSLYANPETLFVKRTNYPFVSYSFAKPESTYALILRNDKKNEYRYVSGSYSYAANLASHRRHTTEFNPNNNYTTRNTQKDTEWRQSAAINIWQLNPTRMVKVPVDMTIQLK